MTRKKGKRQKSPAPEIIEEEVDWSIVARSSGNDDNPTVVGEDVVRGLMWNPETRKMVPQSKLPYQVDEDIGAYHEKLCKLPESDLEAIEEAMDITSNDLAKANEQLTSDEEEEENEVVGGAAGPATANNKEDSVLSVPSILQKAFDQVEGLENSDKRMPQRRASESIARATIADDNNSVISFTSSLERIIEEGMSGGAAAAPAETEGDGASEYSAFSAS